MIYYLAIIIFNYVCLLQYSALSMSTGEFIHNIGYPFEEHRTVSSDGFEIVTHRIPSSPFIPPYDVRIPVLLFHGLVQSSVVFVDDSRSRSLAFLLADQGYDVWLTNMRGNHYSRKHKFLNTTDSEYWNYSFQESALLDLPRLIDYILQTTGHEKLFYIGFSMGTTIGFFLLSALPEYNEKIHAMLMMAPVVYLHKLFYGVGGITLKAILVFGKIWPFSLLKKLRPAPFSPVLRPFCLSRLFKASCLGIGALFSGDGLHQINGTRVLIFLSHYPATTSTRTLYHFFQIRNAKKFIKYNFGKEENLVKYGQPEPPELNLARVTAPVALFSSDSDKVADKDDVNLLKEALPNVDYFEPIKLKGFGHGSFLWGIDTPKLVYERMFIYMTSKIQKYLDSLAINQTKLTFLASA